MCRKVIWSPRAQEAYISTLEYWIEHNGSSTYSNKIIDEVELIELIDDVFGRLGINVSIKINNRKILAGIAELIGEADKITDITVAIDKLDKIGLDNVNKELEEKCISTESIELLQPILMLGGDNGEKLDKLRHILSASTMGQKGIEETETILSYLADCRLAASLELDLTLARGLNYYTGAIIEVKARDVQIGSISGGGRYDNLTGVFGLQGAQRAGQAMAEGHVDTSLVIVAGEFGGFHLGGGQISVDQT
ncbi:ATP phosphoribosyltransferase regulatory subunit, partial [Capnocytophaga granulosa]|uniref:ATP phosphoribosyltransferase regulatory subunit n=1 Tax=Capnocytophaga granulosa TaxID=45242 RepID=UPI003613C8F0